MPKYTAWYDDFNAAIGAMRAGGLIYHFFHEPMYLELTMDYLVFTFIDDSEVSISFAFYEQHFRM